MEGYVYIKSEPGLWTVGFYRPDGRWEPESDWDKAEDAADRVHYLNGGVNVVTLNEQVKELQNQMKSVLYSIGEHLNE